MFDTSAYVPNGIMIREVIYQTLVQLQGKNTGGKCLMLIPDNSRSLALPMMFKMLVEILDEAVQQDFVVALGTHPPLIEDQMSRLVGIRSEERQSKRKHIQILYNSWGEPDKLVSLGVMKEIVFCGIVDDVWNKAPSSQILIQTNKVIYKYDQLINLGLTFPHQVTGFSVGVMYSFLDISGLAMISAMPWIDLNVIELPPVINDIIITLLIQSVMV